MLKLIIFVVLVVFVIGMLYYPTDTFSLVKNVTKFSVKSVGWFFEKGVPLVGKGIKEVNDSID